MKKLFLFAMLATFASTIRAQDNFFYIYLCFGQSNMVGQGAIEPQDCDIEDGVLSMSAVDGPDGRKVGEWRKAVPPLCRANTGLSPVDYFLRVLRKNHPLNVRLGVVHVAIDGCGIDLFDKDACQEYVANVKQDWMKNEIDAYDGNPYQRLVDMARKAQKEGVIRGILLHQGETDAYNDRWLEKVKKIYNDLMADLNLDPAKVPLIAGEAVGKDQNGVCAHANPTINRLPEVLPNSYVVSSEGCEAGPDHLHFTAQGYRTLGMRYGIKMLQAMGFKELGEGMELEATPSVAQPTVTPIDVDASVDDKGVMHAVATKPITKIEYVSFSGNTLKTINMNGETKADVDLNLFPEEKHLVIVFHDKDGASTSIDVTR
jgi:hypothetical protein